ncbi:MAG: queuosine salvage family protein [Syntrophobacterales bacterium]|nr:queuosine salvage family protein [Syntrophobacterales bacterium]
MGETNIRKLLFPVFATTTMVMREARHVKIAPPHVIRECAKRLLSRWNDFCEGSDGFSDSPIMLNRIEASEEELARWLFVIDTVNYSFWPDPGKPLWSVEYGEKRWSGYWGLVASFKRAYEEGVPVTDPLFLSKLSEDILHHIFRGQGEIPLFEFRLSHLREIGRILIANSDIVELINSAEQSAERLVEAIVTYFPSFRDETLYKGRKVFFWKRSQIYVFDLYLAFRGEGLGKFDDIEVLTAFADYKLPQVLRALGIIEYSKNLSEIVDNRVMIGAGSEEEVEIRAATVQAVELLRRELDILTEKAKPTIAARVDQFLWHLGQEDPFRVKPYHLCRTIFY